MSLALAVRSERDSLFSIGPFTNRFLLGAVLLSSLLQGELAITLAASTVVFWAVELKKWVLRRGKPSAAGRAVV